MAEKKIDIINQFYFVQQVSTSLSLAKENPGLLPDILELNLKLNQGTIPIAKYLEQRAKLNDRNKQ